MDRDEQFIELALKARLLSAAQVEDCRKLRAAAGRTAAAPSMEELVESKSLLTPEQMRLLHIALQYEEVKQEDEALAAYLVRKGFLTDDKVSGFLAAQEVPYRRGEPIPRLEDMLIRKGHLSNAQMDNILRSWERGGTRSRMPVAPPSKPAPAAEPAPRNVHPVKLKHLEQGLRQETLKVTFRKSRVDGDLYAAVLQLAGSLDGHTSYKFDQYLNAVTEAGFVHLVLDCGRLEYLSSAGIGILAATIKRCREGKGGDMLLCSVEDKMRRVMQIIGLLSLVKVYENEKTAVASFKA